MTKRTMKNKIGNIVNTDIDKDIGIKKKKFKKKHVLNILMMLCACFIIFTVSKPVYVYATGRVDETTRGEIEGARC